ncbi:MAG: PKD domain-containing protein [Owenweeksia sp.]|nr:PKD domain-containing protein [Owenweeksia sp.]
MWLKIIPDTGSAYSISGQTNASGWFQFTDSSATATGVQVVSISYDCNGATITDTTALVNLGDTLLIPCAQASANICNADFNLSTTSGLKINLKDTSVAWNINAANYTFTWNFGDGTVDTTSTLGDTLIHNYLQAGAYNVCLSLLIYDPFTQIVVCQSTVCQNISVGEAAPAARLALT